MIPCVESILWDLVSLYENISLPCSWFVKEIASLSMPNTALRHEHAGIPITSILLPCDFKASLICYFLVQVRRVWVILHSSKPSAKSVGFPSLKTVSSYSILFVILMNITFCTPSWYSGFKHLIDLFQRLPSRFRHKEEPPKDTKRTGRSIYEPDFRMKVGIRGIE